jgi:hypothetical protein
MGEMVLIELCSQDGGRYLVGWVPQIEGNKVSIRHQFQPCQHHLTKLLGNMMDLTEVDKILSK